MIYNSWFLTVIFRSKSIRVVVVFVNLRLHGNFGNNYKQTETRKVLSSIPTNAAWCRTVPHSLVQRGLTSWCRDIAYLPVWPSKYPGFPIGGPGWTRTNVAVRRRILEMNTSLELISYLTITSGMFSPLKLIHHSPLKLPLFDRPI